MDGLLLSIWFDKIPEKTVVWSANRNDPVEKGSIVELTTDGNLVVKDQKGRQIWSPISADTGISYAALLDTGNLVLASQDNTILWQSFENPTDTLLPTQTMKLDTQVIAHYTETNYSSGRYKFMLQRDGNLLLYTTNFPFNDAVAPYWLTQDSIGTGFQVIFNQSGAIYLAAGNGTLLNTVFPALESTPTQDFYTRATVDYDGVLRQYAYPKSTVATSGGRWPKAWTALSFQPSNICKRIC
ncbi:G-type lectin S-receptor-like serine/threonine-protein kinase LECRK3 [Gossypium hirsutum]|nr:G-type lectin S-receptor-like serine/threonine-protein kinase LECRK3 [Gossypium hirsutum]